jgi:hypothetical protein
MHLLDKYLEFTLHGVLAFQKNKIASLWSNGTREFLSAKEK